MTNSIPQKNGAQPQAPTNGTQPAAHDDAFRRRTPNPNGAANGYHYPAATLEREKFLITGLLSSPPIATALHKQFDGLKSTEFSNPAYGAIYGAAGVLVSEKREPTREAIREELESWFSEGTGERSETDLKAALDTVIAAPVLQEMNSQDISKAKQCAKAIKERWLQLNPPIAPEEISREAKEIARNVQDANKPQSERPQVFELLSFKDLAKMPRPKSLIYSILTEATASALTAKSGDFKSFISLSMALSVATGRAWFGNDVKQGAVVYVAAEGFFTMLDRATAWAQSHGVELPENFHIVKVPVNLADARVVAAFRQSVEAVNPDLIVLDTLSQCAIGINENDNAAMADFVRGMMFLGNEIGAHVQVLHHNAKSTGTFRGAGAIIANIDTHISLDRPEGDETNTVFVRCEKQRGEPFEPFALRGEKVILPFLDEKDKPISTLVFTECGDVVTAKVEKHANAQRADKTGAALLEVFDAVAREAKAKFGIDGVKVGFWKEKVDEADPPICSEPTFWRHRQALEKKSKQIEECGTHNGSPLYRRSGVTITTLTTLNDSDDSKTANVLSQLSHPFRGDSDDSSGDSKPTDNALPEMPKAKQAKKKNAKADGEAYSSEEF